MFSPYVFGVELKRIIKFFASFFIFFLAVPCLFAQDAAETIEKAVARSNGENVMLSDIISQVEKAAANAKTDSDRRSLYTFLGTLTERAGLYEASCRWYASAAGIAAPPAPGTPVFTSEQLVLAAVRAALGGGDYETAETYLASVRGSKNNETIAFVRLYTVWAWLCRAETQDDLVEPVALLESYVNMASMSQVQPSVCLTLWYVTGDSKWALQLTEKYPLSPESSVVSGKAQVLPSPFWYFLPREKTAMTIEDSDDHIKSSPSLPASKSSNESNGSNVIVCHQLGFFRNRENADKLVQRVSAAGFSPSVSEEKRASGTVYYVVTVPDDGSPSMGLRLKTAGFESYPVFAE